MLAENNFLFRNSSLSFLCVCVCESVCCEKFDNHDYEYFVVVNLAFRLRDENIKFLLTPFREVANLLINKHF
jgi:hypothetical protein